MAITIRNKTERRKLISEIIGNSTRTVENHEKQERPYIRLLEYFTHTELDEFLRTGKIQKLEAIKKVDEKSLSLIEGVPYVELKERLTSWPEQDTKEILLKNALFKVENGLDKKLVFPIFKEALVSLSLQETNKHVAVISRMLDKKLGLFSHANHRKLAIQFVEKYLTEEEVELLFDHYQNNK